MSFQSVYFIDIETVPQDFVGGKSAELFEKRFKNQVAESSLEDALENNAGLTAEFGRVVCVSIGKMQQTKFYIKTIINRNEKTILEAVSLALQSATRLGGHNIKDFDAPFLMRRMLINGMVIPPILNTIGKKTWDIPFDDTLEMWSGSQWKYRVSLELLSYVLGLPSSKNEINGSNVADIFYSAYKPETEGGPIVFEKEAEAFKKIGDYCAGDVLATAQIYCKLKGLPLIENIEYV